MQKAFEIKAQSEKMIQLRFIPCWGEIEIAQNIRFPFINGDSLIVEKLSWYLSNIKLLNKNKVVWEDETTNHLFDAGFSGGLSLEWNVRDSLKYDEILFYAGIDSQTSCSGIHVGDLDPLKGMYWTWQSGYINTKIEALTTSGKSTVLHLGGYRSPFSSIRQVKFNLEKADAQIIILVNVQPIVQQAFTENELKIMQPGKKASAFSDIWGNAFSLIKP